jgi:hypothetical protein
MSAPGSLADALAVQESGAIFCHNLLDVRPGGQRRSAHKVHLAADTAEQPLSNRIRAHFARHGPPGVVVGYISTIRLSSSQSYKRWLPIKKVAMIFPG